MGVCCNALELGELWRRVRDTVGPKAVHGSVRELKDVASRSRIVDRDLSATQVPDDDDDDDDDADDVVGAGPRDERNGDGANHEAQKNLRLDTVASQCNCATPAQVAQLWIVARCGAVPHSHVH